MPTNILLVDDDAALTGALSRRLRKEPFTVLIANSGQQALSILKSQPVEVMVTDESMPGMSGVELVTEARERHPDVVSIMLSGQATAGTVIRALNQGQIFRFLIKPCDAQEIASAVHQALVHKQVLDRCRVLLPLYRKMTEVLTELNRDGSAVAEALRETSLIVREEDFCDYNELAQALDIEINRGCALMPKPGPKIKSKVRARRRT